MPQDTRQLANHCSAPSGDDTKVLIIDDDVLDATGVASHLRGLGAFRISRVLGRAAAPSIGQGADLIIIEATLKESVELLRASRALNPAPFVLVTSRTATRARVAALMVEGADCYLEKPMHPVELHRILVRLESKPTTCERFARQLVGRIGLKEAQGLVRTAMSGEALQRTGGSRRAAAKLLGVHRRYVQLLAEQQDP